MRNKMTWWALSLSAVIALALFQPSLGYAGQAMSSHFSLAAAGSAPVEASLIAHGHGGGRGGGMAFNGGGRVWNGGGGHFRHFYGGGTYVEPYYDEPYYVQSYCDNSVWDPDLNQWVCYDTDFD